MSKFIRGVRIFIIAIVFVFIGIGISSAAEAYAASVKITYNGKSHNNSSTRYEIKYGDEVVSKAGFEAIKINSTYMMPYQDIIVDAMKYDASYDEQTGIIIINHNNNSIQMKVGSKKATLNGESVTLPIQPLIVTFEALNTDKLLIPIDYVASELGIYCTMEGSDYIIDEPYSLVYDGETHFYDGVRAKINHNKQLLSTSQVELLKIDGYLSAVADDLFGVFGFSAQFNEATGEYIAENKDTSTVISFRIGDSSYTVTSGSDSAVKTLKVPIRLIDKNSTGFKPYVPVASVLNTLGTTYSWVAGEGTYYVQDSLFFDWSGDIKDDAIINNIYSARGKYEALGDVGIIDLKLSGDLQESFDKITIDRSDKTITVTIPNSVYTPDLVLFDRFGEIVERMEITQADNIVTIKIDCYEVTEFTYTTSDKALHLRLLWDFSAASGKITNYSLTIKRPSGVFISSVSNVECYDAVNYKKRFKIVIKGDYLDFFKNNPVIINNSTVKKVTVKLNRSGNTVIIVDTTSLQGYKIYRDGDNFVVSMNTPKKIYKNIVVLDAGHGGYDDGASYKGTREKNLNFRMIYTLMKGKVNPNAGDTHVYWTRMSDTYITLDTRAKFAAKCKADMFISLHMNSAGSSANGTEVYYSVSNNKKSFSGITSNKVATLMKNRLIEKLGTKNRGVKTAAFYVIKYNSVPAILIELGFITGSQDYKRLTNSSFQKKATTTIYDTINELFTKYDTGR